MYLKNHRGNTFLLKKVPDFCHAVVICILDVDWLLNLMMQ